ncbi:zinc metallochaperone AztD [Dietzia kunjamensis]|uniref:zinc metallochaperone AztD n=1 Tax=Dietzia kunjamensis TaxID=322509 RepID=UPI002DBA2646|nr:zinc metallochaperone AztD [Dietzia kunjamensis]MEB8326882.1 zinc metallochaperone AztD [Dietzia kunjamensis]
MIKSNRFARPVGTTAIVAGAVLLSACTTPAETAGPDQPVTARGSEASDHARPTASAADVTEQRRATPRLAATYDGGMVVLDARTLDPIADLRLEGYNRLSPSGDDRHVAVSTSGGFRMLDTGTWAEPHGDHAHHYTAEPALSDVLVEAETPGHVVAHGGRTAFFDDGAGRITVVDSEEVADPAAERSVIESESAHHGVAVVGPAGEIVSTLGDDDARTGLIARSGDGEESARTEECPGVHGEAAASDALVFGCTDGVVVYSGGRFTKVDAPDQYGRIGNQAGSPVSPVVLGDYKVDEDADLERPTRVSLIDTRTSTLRLVDLPASYSFRSLGRGPEGQALVLGTDGRLHEIDPETGRLTRSLDVVEPWTEPLDWQEPRPTLYVRGGTAYVTEPDSRRLVAVDLADGRVRAEVTLDQAVDEITGVGGDAPEDR